MCSTLKTMEVVGSGDTVTERGEYILKMQVSAGKTMEDHGKYMVVWKNTPDGWKLHWDMWTTNQPQKKISQITFFSSLSNIYF